MFWSRRMSSCLRKMNGARQEMGILRNQKCAALRKRADERTTVKIVQGQCPSVCGVSLTLTYTQQLLIRELLNRTGWVDGWAGDERHTKNQRNNRPEVPDVVMCDGRVGRVSSDTAVSSTLYRRRPHFSRVSVRRPSGCRLTHSVHQ